MKWKSKRRQVIALSILMVLHVPSVLMDSWGLDQHQSIAQEKEKKETTEEQKVEVKEVEGIEARPLSGEHDHGLLGYYYIAGEEKSTEPCCINESKTGDLSASLTAARECIERLHQQPNQKLLNVAQWKAYVQVHEEGEYMFNITGHDQFVITFGDEQSGVAVQKMTKIRLKPNKWYELTIQCSDIQKAEQVKLCWQTPGQTEQQVVPKEALILKNVKIDEQQKVADLKRNVSLVGRSTQQKSTLAPDTKENNKSHPIIAPMVDTDGDGIPDDWEIHGYTVDEGQLVKWRPEFESNPELQKRISSPCLWSTTGDPYSDYDKAMGYVDGQVSAVARDPLVAAYPIVTASIEQVMLFPNKDNGIIHGGNHFTAMTHSAVTTDVDSNETSKTVGLIADKTNEHKDIKKDKGLEVNLGIAYEKKWSKSVAQSDSKSLTEQTDWVNKSFFNEANEVAIAFGIRYENSGTAPIYGLQPTSIIYLQNKDGTISSVYGTKTQYKQKMKVLYPNSQYPSKQHACGILLGNQNVFNSSTISLNKDQFHSYLQFRTFYIATPQWIGKARLKDRQGQLTIDKEWVQFMPQIQARTAQLQLCIPGERGMTRRVAARDARVPNLESIPSLTIGEALERAYGMTAVGNGAYTFVKETGENEADEKYVFKNGFRIELDEKTKQKYKAQQAQTKDNDLMNFKLTPGATIKIIPNDGFVYNETKDIAYYYEKGELVKGPKSFGPESPPLLSKENDNKMNQPFVHQYVMKQKKEKHYYFDLKGHFWTGWRTDENGDRYYYAEESSDFEKGERVTGIREIAGKPYYFDEKDGRLKKQGWHRLFPVDFDVFASVRFLSSRLGDWYVREEGQLASGWQEINGKTYYFDPKNKYMLAIGKRVIDGKTYLFNAAGEHQLKEGQRHEVEKQKASSHRT